MALHINAPLHVEGNSLTLQQRPLDIRPAKHLLGGQFTHRVDDAVARQPGSDGHCPHRPAHRPRRPGSPQRPRDSSVRRHRAAWYLHRDTPDTFEESVCRPHVVASRSVASSSAPGSNNRTHSRCDHRAHPPLVSVSLSWLVRMVASRGDASASRSGTSRTLASEYGANGHGSTRPDGLMWMNPRPAARHPPKTSSSPGNTMNKPRNRFCSEATTATSRARWALSRTSDSVPSRTGTYSTKKNNLHPRSMSPHRYCSSSTASMFRRVTVSDVPKKMPALRMRTIAAFAFPATP